MWGTKHSLSPRDKKVGGIPPTVLHKIVPMTLLLGPPPYYPLRRGSKRHTSLIAILKVVLCNVNQRDKKSLLFFFLGISGKGVPTLIVMIKLTIQGKIK